MYNNCTETHLSGAVYSFLSSRWSPLLSWSPLLINRSCDITYVTIHVLATTMMQPNTIVCVNERVAILFSVWKLQIQPVTDLCKSPVSYWWPTASCCSSRESCELLKLHSFDKTCVCIHLLNIINLSISLVKRLVYPILSASCELLCINWNENEP